MKKLNLSFYFNKKKLRIKKRYYTFFLFKSKWTRMSVFFSEQNANTALTKTLSWSFDRWICLNIPAAEATMQPPVGPLLGQHGFNTASFCKGFNDLTTFLPWFLPLWVFIKLFKNKSLLFWIKLPSISYLTYATVNTQNWKYVSVTDILKLVFLKKIDYPKLSIIGLTGMVIGTLKSMNISIKWV